jgi:hypothetical protein
MTLRCDCGSHAIEIVDADYPAESGMAGARETYECQDCGRTGTLHADDRGNTRRYGCLTSTYEVDT